MSDPTIHTNIAGSTPVSEFQADITQLALRLHSFLSAAEVQPIYSKLRKETIDLDATLSKTRKDLSDLGGKLSVAIENNKKLEHEFKCVEIDKQRLMGRLQSAMEKLDSCVSKLEQKDEAIVAVANELKRTATELNDTKKALGVWNDKLKGEQLKTKERDDTIIRLTEDAKHYKKELAKSNEKLKAEKIQMKKDEIFVALREDLKYYKQMVDISNEKLKSELIKMLEKDETIVALEQDKKNYKKELPRCKDPLCDASKRVPAANRPIQTPEDVIRGIDQTTIQRKDELSSVQGSKDSHQSELQSVLATFKELETRFAGHDEALMAIASQLKETTKEITIAQEERVKADVKTKELDRVKAGFKTKELERRLEVLEEEQMMKGEASEPRSTEKEESAFRRAALLQLEQFIRDPPSPLVFSVHARYRQEELQAMELSIISNFPDTRAPIETKSTEKDDWASRRAALLQLERFMRDPPPRLVFSVGGPYSQEVLQAVELSIISNFSDTRAPITMANEDCVEASVKIQELERRVEVREEEQMLKREQMDDEFKHGELEKKKLEVSEPKSNEQEESTFRRAALLQLEQFIRDPPPPLVFPVEEQMMKRQKMDDEFKHGELENTKLEVSEPMSTQKEESAFRRAALLQLEQFIRDPPPPLAFPVEEQMMKHQNMDDEFKHGELENKKLEVSEAKSTKKEDWPCRRAALLQLERFIRDPPPRLVFPVDPAHRQEKLQAVEPSTITNRPDTTGPITMANEERVMADVKTKELERVKADVKIKGLERRVEVQEGEEMKKRKQMDDEFKHGELENKKIEASEPKSSEEESAFRRAALLQLEQLIRAPPSPLVFPVDASRNHGNLQPAVLSTITNRPHTRARPNQSGQGAQPRFMREPKPTTVGSKTSVLPPDLRFN